MCNIFIAFIPLKQYIHTVRLLYYFLSKGEAISSDIFGLNLNPNMEQPEPCSSENVLESPATDDDKAMLEAIDIENISLETIKKPYQKRMTSISLQSSMSFEQSGDRTESLNGILKAGLKKPMLQQCRATSEGMRLTRSFDREDGDVDAILARKHSSLGKD